MAKKIKSVIKQANKKSMEGLDNPIRDAVISVGAGIILGVLSNNPVLGVATFIAALGVLRFNSMIF